MTPQEWAILFHDTYERLAPQFGYETRNETRKFDPSTPNGKLMIAVCSEVVKAARVEGQLYGMKQALTALDEYGERDRAREEILKDIAALERGKV